MWAEAAILIRVPFLKVPGPTTDWAWQVSLSFPLNSLLVIGTSEGVKGNFCSHIHKEREAVTLRFLWTQHSNWGQEHQGPDQLRQSGSHHLLGFSPSQQLISAGHLKVDWAFSGEPPSVAMSLTSQKVNH